MQRYKTHFIFTTYMINKCIQVGIVNYRNTLPLLVGLEALHQKGVIDLHKNYPSAIAKDLIDGKIELGLVPVAILPLLPNAKIVGKHCIASRQTVASVCLFSNVPIHQVSTILLDYQSRTSVQLIKVLCKDYWKINVEFQHADTDYISQIKNTTAGVIIGDRAFEHAANIAYQYDLAEAWVALTGLPFVFAVWVSTTELSADFINQFDAANEIGLQNIDEVAKLHHYEHYDLKKYFTQNIDYVLDDSKIKSLDLFLEKLKTI
jgi:chorismate dehydratase